MDHQNFRILKKIIDFIKIQFYNTLVVVSDATAVA
jgi:hypothetical protein